MVDFYRAPPSTQALAPSDRPAIVHDQDEDDDGLGPLPTNWEKAYTENGETYFIDHSTGTSHWLDPRLSRYQKKSLEDCQDDELPYGWEKIQDPQYGTYFIDHVNRRTQYENPVLEAKRRSERRRMAQAGPQTTILPAPSTTPSTASNKPNPFTKNPSELQGERINTTLLKSSRGLGFTIIGGDDNIDEFLQIKSIVPNGPAWLDGKLLTGDVLVYVNDTCTLGFKHHEMVNVFQSIMAGETVNLEVCRGYTLPFDPLDPNTEVVTTIAVEPTSNAATEKIRSNLNVNKDGGNSNGYNFMDMKENGKKSATLQKDGNENNKTTNENILKCNKDDDSGDAQILQISISKGPLGFGFTVADSAYGQKVKKILDPNCCKDLQEGDLLLAIDNTNVMYMNHNSVVQVLKNCSRSKPALIKIQRGSLYNGALALELNNWRDNANIDSDGNLFRSKTPTADTYSTKEILPVRSKTPLFEIRNRTKTPSNETNGAEEVDSLLRRDVNRKHVAADTKSNSSIPDQDSINNEVPHMDAFPKLVSNITERLAETSLSHNGRARLNQSNINQFEHESNNFATNNLDFYRNIHSNGNYSNSPNSSTYAVASGEMQTKLSYLEPVPTYHHDNCYCYECTDYNRYQRETLHQRQKQYNQYVQSQNYNVRYGQDGQILPAPYITGKENGFDLDLYEITLERRAQGFGFRIVGGTEEGSQVTVGHIVPGGSADADPRISTGDEILSIDGHNVVQGSHQRVVQLMGEAAQRGYVTMILRRRSQNINAARAQFQQLQQHQQQTVQFPYDVVVNRNEHEGFGFVIISASNQYYGSTIGQILPGSPGERCGELKVGDRIVAVNGGDISGIAHGDVVNLIKESGLYVRLTIGDPNEDDYRHAGETNEVGTYEHHRMQSQLCL